MGFGGNGTVVSPWLVSFFWFCFLFNFVSVVRKKKFCRGTYSLDSLRLAICSPNFHEECTTFNNVLSMAATKVCNYCNTPGLTNHGPGNVCVMLNG
jgi:hypothetical protein